ncbi:MAG TPA: putative baseplate assembly protein [Terracidiphilus sp.]|nr:putative baseplate assembly protein [Terracidiphilus sp.]
MKQPCGCCAGIEVVTPQSELNRPGLRALNYRAGTYGTFFESMLARISSLYLDVPVSVGSDKLQRIFPLNGLTLNGGVLQRVGPGLSTRELSDPSIALLDAFATVADVLTFYQERIANEGYLRTATELRSVLELARLVGYRLRPGVSASVYLSFTVNDGFAGTIPAGTRAQSIPQVGQKPQPFETSDDLDARGTWNNLQPRLTRPQIITLASSPQTDAIVSIDQGTDAATRDTIYFSGIATNLSVGDALLFVAGDGPGQQVLRFAQEVNVQNDQKRTEVVLQESAFKLQNESGSPAQAAAAELDAVLGPYIADAETLFSGGDLANQVAEILQTLINDATALSTGATNPSAADVAQLVPPVIPQIDEKHEVAVRRGFTRLEPWIADISSALRSLAEQLSEYDDGEIEPQQEEPITGSAVLEAPSLGRLFGIVDRLKLAPSLQPANTFRLQRSVQQVFAAQSDTQPRLLATFAPAAAKTLYQAWGSVETTPTPLAVYAMRVKASPFGSNAALQVSYQGDPPSTPIYSDWPMAIQVGQAAPNTIYTETSNILYLDAAYNKVVPQSWVVVDTSAVDTTQTKVVTNSGLLFAKAGDVKSITRAAYGMSSKTTRLALVDPATSGQIDWIDATAADPNSTTDFLAIRQTVVYAQPEELQLAEEPLDRDVEGSTIELDGLYDGLESGRWIIISGQRTDINDATGAVNATGIVGNELVMIGQVTQGPGKQFCMPLSFDAVPFSGVYSVAGPDAAGNLLIVGQPNQGLTNFITSLPVPTQPDGTQQICNPVQLAPGLYANAYLPTAAERLGDFSAFSASIIDPATNKPVPGNKIPPSRMDSQGGLAANLPPLYAWRIASLASGEDTLHTTLVLANSLAYQYDSSTVKIYGNVAKATHGQTQGEVLGDGDASRPSQQFALHQSPLTYLPVPTPSGVQSTLEVTVNEIEWHEAGNLFELGPADREYITETDDQENTTVIMGNGIHSLRVPSGTGNVKATYRSGTGQAGNVDAQQISQLATQPLGVKSVINPLAASGGADGDTVNEARRNVPIGLLSLDRLVSVQDYADFARNFAGIAKASSRRLTDGRRLVVHLTIAGKNDISIDPTSDLYKALVLALEQAGDPNQPVQIDLRRLKVLVISAGVKIQPDYVWESVAANLRAAILDLYSFDNRCLGQSAFLSEAVAVMQAVAGVQYVDMQKFDSVAQSVTAAQLTTLASTLTVQPFVEAELAHESPGQGILPAELVILTPDIPDTLILTEITS